MESGDCFSTSFKLIRENLAKSHADKGNSSSFQSLSVSFSFSSSPPPLSFFSSLFSPFHPRTFPMPIDHNNPTALFPPPKKNRRPPVAQKKPPPYHSFFRQTWPEQKRHA